MFFTHHAPATNSLSTVCTRPAAHPPRVVCFHARAMATAMSLVRPEGVDLRAKSHLRARQQAHVVCLVVPARQGVTGVQESPGQGSRVRTGQWKGPLGSCKGWLMENGLLGGPDRSVDAWSRGCFRGTCTENSREWPWGGGAGQGDAAKSVFPWEHYG